MQYFSRRLLVASLCVALSGCSTISDWFADEEELEVRRLDPIENQFEARTLWSESVGEGVGSYYSRLRPALGYDMVFAASRQGEVIAFEEATGKRVWRRNFATFEDEGYLSFMTELWTDGVPAKISGGMSVAYETVFFGTENGEVYALDAKTGETKWQTNVRGEVLAAPAVEENVVVVSTGSGIVHALDAVNGEEKWTYESDVPALSLRGISAPTAAGGGAIVGTANGRIAVNLLESGQTAWEQTVGTPSGATELDRIVDVDGKPLVLGGTVFAISYEGTLAAIELRSGRMLWKREYGSFRRASVSGNSLYLVDVNSTIYALDRRNGIELWSQRALKGRTLTAAEPVGDYIVVGDNYGYLHWLTRDEGQLVSRLEVGGDDEDESIFASPIAKGKVLYTQTRDGELHAIETP